MPAFNVSDELIGYFLQQAQIYILAAYISDSLPHFAGFAKLFIEFFKLTIMKRLPLLSRYPCQVTTKIFGNRFFYHFAILDHELWYCFKPVHEAIFMIISDQRIEELFILLWICSHRLGILKTVNILVGREGKILEHIQKPWNFHQHYLVSRVDSFSKFLLHHLVEVIVAEESPHNLIFTVLGSQLK